MQQQITTEMENWLLNNQKDFTRLFNLNISEEQILAATENNCLLLSTALKEEYNLAIIIQLPSLSGLTEVIVSDKSIDNQLNSKEINLLQN